MEINSTKVQNKLHAYNYEALAKILSTNSEQHDESSPDASKPPTVDGKPKDDKWSWRQMLPRVCMEEMIISSYGDEFPQSVNIARKLHDNTIDDKEMPHLARKELDAYLDKSNSQTGNKSMLKYFCTDFPGAQFSREYYFDRMKCFLTENETGGATLLYTGHSEVGTGNWCFKDGIITFENIFGLYMDHFKGKRLTIISDCSYSGQWVVDAVNKMDEIGLPSCGHHTREEFPIKVFASCQPNEEALALAFIESVFISNDGWMSFSMEKLESGQKPYHADFRSIRCRKRESEPCEIDPGCTWKDRIISKTKNIFLVRGKDKGKPAWHFVLVDEEKVDTFKVKIASGQIDVADYGRVILSGWGKDPPQEQTDKVDQMFLGFIHPK